MDERVATLRDLLPSQWYAVEGRKVLMMAFRVLRAPLATFPPDDTTLDLLGCRAVVFWGRPRFLAADVQVEFTEDEVLRYELRKPQVVEAPTGRYTVVASPFDPGEGDHTARERTDAVLGLLYAQSGRNIAYDRIYEFTVDLAADKLSLIDGWIENPFVLPVPRLANADVEALRAIGTAIGGRSAPDQQKILLSLRWFRTAVGHGGPDALLRYWIALEALAMPNTTNIRPINDRLARIYTSASDPRLPDFRIGKLFGARSAIVHGGTLASVIGLVLGYLAAVYWDLLLDECGLQPEFCAGRHLKEHGEQVDACLKALLG